ncbi:MAG: xanthine dehydrogenase family protein molybdopterin-binding subunit [Acidimicrobiia bacterium]
MTQTDVRVTEQTKGGIGDRVRRVEDERFLTGQGQYLGDLRRPDLKHIGILRSPIAHARIRNVDVSNALGLPGVIAAFTGDELAEFARPFSHLLPMIPTLQQIQWHALAIGKVRYVGEPVAAVVADSRYIAEDALELVEVDFEELPPVVDTEAALAVDAPKLYDDWPSNDFLFMPFATGDIEGAFASADGVVRERFTHHRITGLPLEGHGALGEYDPSTERLTLHASTQQPHNLRTVISDVTGIPENKVRVVAPDMGGGFGNKAHFFREEALVALVATRVPHPVVWSADRVENLTASLHSREQTHDVEVAYGADGRVLAIRAKIVADVGNPEVYILGCAPAVVTTSLLAGAYDIPNYAYELHCVVTNKCPMGGYRGYGQPQANFTIERVMDLVAEQVGLDPVEVRRRNLIPDEPRPFVSPTGAHYDTGSFHAQLAQVLEAIDYEGVRREQERARSQGRYLGIGVASLVEPTAPNIHALAGRFACYEMAMIVVQPDGHVNVHVGTKSQGQGHATVFAQVASDVLTVPVAQVDVRDGDTGVLPYGMGTWGSRSAVMGGGAVLKAAREIRDKMTVIAANMLQASPSDVELVDGMFRAGEAAVPFAEIASAAYLHTFLLPAGTDMGLATIVGYDPGGTSHFPDPESGHLDVGATYSSAAAAAVVEVDPNTGRTTIRDAVIVHDCGTVINPMILDGQIQGAFAQAVGATFLEEFVYSPEGQPLCSTLLDYQIPAFGDVPRVRVIHSETASALLGGFRGGGEGAIIITPAVLANAVHDALRPVGVKITQTNLGAHHVRDLVRAAGVPIDALAGVGS